MLYCWGLLLEKLVVWETILYRVAWYRVFLDPAMDLSSDSNCNHKSDLDSYGFDTPNYEQVLPVSYDPTFVSLAVFATSALRL